MKLRNFFKNLIPLFIVLVLFTIYYLLFSSVVFAAEGTARIGIACELYKYPWCGKAENPGALVATFYRIALGLVGGAALGVLIYGAILWTLSEAVTSKEEAKKWITGAVWGLALLLGAYLILYTINPDLVNIGQTQSFLNELIQPVKITPPSTIAGPATTRGEALAELNDPQNLRRYFLTPGIDILTNKDEPYTSLANLPATAINGVLKIRKECPDCTLVITGGTEEAGHKEHGSNKAVLDLRLKQSQGYMDTQLNGYIRDKIGLKSGLFAETMEYDKRYAAKDGSFTVIKEKNTAEGTEHFHIVFK